MYLWSTQVPQGIHKHHGAYSACRRQSDHAGSLLQASWSQTTKALASRLSVHPAVNPVLTNLASLSLNANGCLQSLHLGPASYTEKHVSRYGIGS
jgi:hypothetical protein